MADFPCLLIEFQRRFADEGACASYLADARWPDGFRCPDCGHPKGWELATKAFTWGHRQLDGCGREKLGGEVEAAVRRPRQRR